MPRCPRPHGGRPLRARALRARTHADSFLCCAGLTGALHHPPHTRNPPCGRGRRRGPCRCRRDHWARSLLMHGHRPAGAPSHADHDGHGSPLLPGECRSSPDPYRRGGRTAQTRDDFGHFTGVHRLQHAGPPAFTQSRTVSRLHPGTRQFRGLPERLTYSHVAGAVATASTSS